MTRLRSPAQRAPQTKEQALVLLDRYAALDAEILAHQAERQAAHQKIDAIADALVITRVAEMKDIVKQLKPWWAGNFDELTGGKRKSIELGGCLIGYRISPPSVKFAHGNDEAAADQLLGADYAELVRTRHSPDKPAILKLLEGDAPQRLHNLGFSVDQKEVFFVDPIGPGDVGLAVADPAAGAVA